MRHSKIKIAGLILIISVFSFAWSNAETLLTKKETSPSITEYLNLRDYQSSQKLYALASADSGEKPHVSMDVYRFKEKSTKRGFLYSLLIPGAGEFYAGSKIKAVLFFGMEVAFWSGYFSYHKKGKNKEDEFMDFADVHWSEEAYKDSLWYRFDEFDIDTLSYSGWVYNNDLTDSINISHRLPDTKDQQYYEMVGKWEQFRFGWDDYDDSAYYILLGDYRSPHWATYLDMRDKSNSLLNKANKFVMVSLANHLLSAFDAAIAVRSYNRKGERFSTIDFKLRLVEYDQKELIPKLIVSTKF